MVSAPYLGKIRLYWCTSCNVPLVSEKCGCCGSGAVKVNITPPGDVRPGFNYDYRVVKEAVNKLAFGLADFFSHPILLNHVGYIDRMDEVISDGYVLGSVRFVPEDWDFEFVPSSEGAQILFAYLAWRLNDFWKAVKRFRHVIVDKVAGEKIAEGYNVLAPGIISYSKFRVGDYVLVFSESGYLVGVGRALVNSDAVPDLKRGAVIKGKSKFGLQMDFECLIGILERIFAARSVLDEKVAQFLNSMSFTNESSQLSDSNYDPFKLFPKGIENYWLYIVYCNQNRLKVLEKEAIGFIRGIVKRHESEFVGVSFSGGKDSIATLELVIRSNVDFIVLFIDTGIEMPQTTEYALSVINKIRKIYNDAPVESMYNDTKVILSDHAAVAIVPESRFWDGVKKLGYPGMDWRWCCKSNKLAPARLLSNILGNKITINFEGIRKYESFQRAAEGRYSRNIWTGHLNAYPIYNWNALEVWLYILWRRLPTNPLYGLGLYRVGCWPCPSSHLADLYFLSRINPELFERLKRVIIEALSKEHPSDSDTIEEIFRHGVWRWRKVPKKIAQKKTLRRPARKILTLKKINDNAILIETNLDEDPEYVINLINQILKKYREKFEIKTVE